MIKCMHCHGFHKTLLGIKECATNIATTDTAGQARERRERLKEQFLEDLEMLTQGEGYDGLVVIPASEIGEGDFR